MAEFKEQTLRRYQKAVDRKKVEDLKKNYIFVCPRRYPGGGETKVADEVFDSTGIDATSTKVGKQHNQIFRLFMNGSTQFRQSAFRKRKSTVGKSIKNSLKNCCIRLWKSLTFMKSLKTS